MIRWTLLSVPAALMSLAGSVVAATVSWTGLGDGINWSDPANWSGGVLPGPADDVTINVANNPSIVIAGVNPTILSLNSAEELRINAGSTFTTTTATSSAPFRIAGGVIQGGTWTFTGGGAFQIVTSTEGRLNNPTINGEIIFTDSSARLRVGASTTFTAMRFRASSQSAAFEPGFVLNSQIIADGAGFTSAWIETFANGSFTVGPTGVIASAPGGSRAINVAQGFWYSATTALTVQGVISHAGTGTSAVDASTLSVAATGRIENIGTGTLNVGTRTAPNTWSSSGTIRATNGQLNLQDGFTNNGTVEASETARVTLEGAWTNSGTIALSGTARLDLGGTFTTASIGTISRGGGGTDGVIAVTGAWNNTGATYNFSAAGGAFILEGGTITGGTINPSGGFVLRMGNNGNNALNGVNYTGEVRLDRNSSRFRLGTGSTIGGVRVSAPSTGVSVPPNSTVNFPIVIDSNASIGTFGLDVQTAGTLTWGPSASITSIGTWTGTISLGASWWSNAATEFINQGAITLAGAGRTLTIGGNRFTNNAGASVSASGGTTLTIDVTNSDTNEWTNAGTINVTDSPATFRDLWSVTGTVNVNNSIVSLEGRFESPSLLRFTRTGGQMNIVGRLDNTGRTTTLGPATGTWRILGGTVVGGTFDTTPTERLAPTGSNGTIENVTFLDELVFDDGSSTRARILGTTTMPSLRLVSASSGPSYSSGYVITYPIISDSPGFVTHAVDSATPGATLTIGSGGSISSAPGSNAALSVGSGFWNNQTATLINQGVIDQRAFNRTLDVGPVAFTNTGTVRVRNSADGTITGLSGTAGNFEVQEAGSTLNLNGTYTLAGTLNVNPNTSVRLRGNWSNTGTIAINNGVLELDGNFSVSNLGTFTNTGGSVTIFGTLDNAAGLTLNAATGSWTLGSGGRITGGTVNQTQGSRLNFAGEGTLENVQFTSEMVLSITSGRARLVGTSRAPSYRLTAGSSGLLFPPGHVVNETIVSEGVGSKGVELWGDGTLTLGPSSRIVAQQSTINVGSFWASSTGRTLVAQGVMESIGNGSTIAVNPPIFANYDTATGTLTGGTYRGLQGGNFTFNSNFIRNNAATFEFEGSSGSGVANELTRLEVNSGTLALFGGRDAIILNGQQGDTTLTNNGTLILGAGSRLTLGNPGRAANFSQGPNGRVRFDLGGTDTANGHGSLRVFGAATLGGEIEADYVNGFQRACGQIFQVIDANSRAGEFATRDLPPITDETVFLLFYGGADVRLTVSARADFNEDGFLDFFDYAEFVECFEGNCPPGLSADFNGDGFVDFFDYLDYVFRFEAGCE